MPANHELAFKGAAQKLYRCLSFKWRSRKLTGEPSPLLSRFICQLTQITEDA